MVCSAARLDVCSGPRPPTGYAGSHGLQVPPVPKALSVLLGADGRLRPPPHDKPSAGPGRLRLRLNGPGPGAFISDTLRGEMTLGLQLKSPNPGPFLARLPADRVPNTGASVASVTHTCSAWRSGQAKASRRMCCYQSDLATLTPFIHARAVLVTPRGVFMAAVALSIGFRYSLRAHAVSMDMSLAMQHRPEFPPKNRSLNSDSTGMQYMALNKFS